MKAAGLSHFRVHLLRTMTNRDWVPYFQVSPLAILMALFVAIPLGFSKHRRHWLTIRTDNDFAVLKLSKSNRKFIIPAFETKSGVTVEAVGEDK